ncbi:MAG: phage tail tape measure protein, partial [Lachnospiraceae bacterium]|nr:phage tail tape measure protein [Lachnospiraceae bacterium]
MSTTVDSRVVEMQFDNSKFESNVKTSLSTLDKLKSALNFSGVSDSFSNITTSAGKVDMSPLSGAIETVHQKFSAMEVVAVTALVNITNQAISAGEQLVKSLSVDNIASGWEKFSEKTQSVATLVSQGYDLETVTEQLERLNWYTDETSYNFTDMVSNIAKFTASGQDLETSVTAMEGIANWAALSGQNATTASRAMYQLSQAMSAGYMRLEDYKSIQNASMDTEEFRQKCIDAAVALGTLQDNADGTYTSIVDGASSTTFTLSSFTTGLTDGMWMTSDVMMEVFNEYSSAVDQIYEYAEEKGITASEAIEELGDSVDEFGLKAFKAAQEARSWADVIDSVKDAVSTGWMNTFEYIFGNEEEAIELWTDLANAMYDVFAEGGNARNEMLAEWKELGGRDVLVDAFWTAWDNIGEVLGTVKEAFRDIFPSTTADQLYSFTEGLKTFAENLKMSDENLENLSKTFKGVFSVLDIVKQALSAVFNGVKTLFGGVGSLASSILGVTGSIGDWLVALDESVEKSDIFNKVVEKIVDAIKTFASFVSDNLSPAVEEIKKKFSDFIEEVEESTVFTKITEGATNFIEKVKEKFSTPGFDLFHEVLSGIGTVIETVITAITNLKNKIVGAFDEIGEAVSGLTLVKVLGAIWSAIMKLASALSDVLGDALSGLISALGNADFNEFFDVLNSFATTGLIASVVELIHNFASGIGDLTNFIKKMKNGVVDILDGVGECLETWQNNIKADTLLKIAASVGILAIALIALTGVDAEKMGTAIAAITGLMFDLVVAMTALNQFTGSSSSGWKEGITSFMDTMSDSKQYANMIKMAGAIAILAAAMALIGTIDSDKIDSAFGSITGLILDLTVAMIALNKLGGNVSGTTTMLALAASVLLLSSAMKSLSELDWEGVAKGLVSVTAMLGELVAAMILLGKYGESTSGAVTMIALAAAIKILASACETFADLSWEGIAKGAVAIAALMAGLVLAMGELTAINTNMISTGLALIEVAAAMKIFASAIEDFGGLSWEEIAKGLVAMGVALAEVTVAVNLMPKGMTSKAAALVVLGAALEIIADVVNDMSGLSWEKMTQGLLGMGIALAELAVALTYMQGSVADAAAILVVAAALAVLTPVLKSLGEMSIGELATSLIALAGALTIIGAAAVISSIPGFTTAMIAMAGAVALVGAGLLAAGVGITAISVGITSLAASMSVSLVSIVSGISAIVVAIVSLIPDILIAIGEGIVGICGVIADGASTIGEAVVAIILAVIDILRECVPELVSGVLDIVLQVLDALVEYVPSIVTGLVDLLIGVVEALGDSIPKILVAVMDFIGKLFQGIIDAINGLDSSALVEGITCVGLLSALVVALSAISGMVPAAMVALLELAGLVAEMGVIIAAFGALAQIPGLEWLIGEGADLLGAIGDAIGSFVGGIVGGALEEVTSKLPKIGSDLSLFMENASVFLEGASKIDSNVSSGILALAAAVVALTAADIITGLTSWITGGTSFLKFGMELAAFGPYFASYCNAVKGIDGDDVEASANAISCLAEVAKELPNSGGVVSWFTGDNGLADFGKELSEFGPYMASYYDSIKEIDGSVVESSTNAAKALAEFASSLPEQGGLKGVVDWIVGNGTMSLSDFGKELAKFGPYLKEYSDSVTGVKPQTVKSSVSAATALSEMAKNLPERSSIIDWITGSGNMTLSKFGKELAKFGPYLKEYSDSVTGVKPQTVKSSVSAATALSEMAKNLPERSSIIDWITGSGNM